MSNGTCCVAGHQAYVIKEGTRFFNSNAVAYMGYGLPAAIGGCVANKRRTTVCLEGDGSIIDVYKRQVLTVATKEMEHFSRYGTVQFDDSGRIIAFREKQPCQHD